MVKINQSGYKLLFTVFNANPVLPPTSWGALTPTQSRPDQRQSSPSGGAVSTWKFVLMQAGLKEDICT